MGVGRRMKKQGAPEPLSEEHFAKLKRKAGLPVDAPTEDSPAKKRRRANKPAAPAAAPSKKAAPARASNGKPGKASVRIGSLEKTPKEKSRPAATVSGKLTNLTELIGSDDDAEDLSDIEDDEDESADQLGDDFLGSDSSVYDSDTGANRKEDFVFSEDEDESDAEEKLTSANIVGLSKRLDEQMAKEAEESKAELQESALQTNIEGDEPHIFEEEDDDSGLAAKTKTLLAPDLQLLRTRITETIRVLEDFSKLGEEGRSRVEYTAQLLKDICAYYGYSEYLAEKLYNLFSPREAFAFFEANETARPVVIRTNTLKTHRRALAQALINRGVTLEPVGKWSKVGLQIFESNVPIGATPEYLAGHYILQAASSFLPVMALAPQEHEMVLDMASAPGGKATHMAALMKNTGTIFANDASKARAKALNGNVHRLGARNVIISTMDATEFPKIIRGFDRVLLDAPCSGTGVIAKDASVKVNKTEKDFMQLPHIQKRLLLAAIDCTDHTSKTGGYLVYSTCSVTVEENESVVAYALKARPNVRLVETGLTFGKEGFTSFMGKSFDPSLKMTRRFYPHHQNVDGFFVAKFKKFGPTPPNAVMANGVSNGNGKAGTSSSGPRAVGADGDSEMVDRTPIRDEDAGKDGADDFAGFDDEEDAKIMQRAKRNAMRRRGLDPRALDRKDKMAEKEKKPNGEKEDASKGAKDKDKKDKKAKKAKAEQ